MGWLSQPQDAVNQHKRRALADGKPAVAELH